MGTKLNTKRLLAATFTVAGLAAGAMAVHADTFSQRSAQGASQDLAVTPPPVWPSVPPTPGCATECNLTLHVGTGSASVNRVDAAGTSTVDSVPFWGFGVNAGAPALAGAPSSIIKVPQGAKLHIAVDQAAGTGDAIDLSFPSLPGADVTKVNATHFDVTASQVGTSVFQPGTNVDAPRQISMGLVGVLVVTPTACADATNNACAFDGTAYNDEAVLATTTLDAEFAANPLASGANSFDMSYFGKARDANDQPRKVYYLINGEAFPNTQVIDAKAGDKLLLRVVNASVFDNSMGLLGLRESLLGRNASAYTDPQTFVAPLVGPGETADVSVDIPADAVAGQRYSLMDQGRQMNHGDASGFGGALTFINVWAGAPVAPTITNLAFDFGTNTLSGTANPSSPAFPVQTVEWSTTSAAGPWTAATGTTSFTASIPVTGDVTVYLQATDSNTLVGTAQKLVQPGPPTLTGLAYDLTTGHLTGAAAPSDPLIPVTKVEYSLDALATIAGTITAAQITSIDTAVTLTAPSTITVRATDANGKTATGTVDVLPAAPVVVSAGLVNNAGSIDLAGTATATAGLTIAAAEFFDTSNSVAGPTTSMAVTPNGASYDLAATPNPAPVVGDVLTVRVQDSFGQWSNPFQLTVTTLP